MFDLTICSVQTYVSPPYSPDDNPIEQVFSSIKAYLHRHQEDKTLMAMVRACQSVTPDHAAGYFRASGYM
jgi:hypothetical protein